MTVFQSLKKFLLAVTFKNKSVQIKPHMLPLCTKCVCFELYNYHSAHLRVKLRKKRKHTLGNAICYTWQGWFSLYHLYHRLVLTLWRSLCGNSDHRFVFVVVLVGAETFPGSVDFYE